MLWFVVLLGVLLACRFVVVLVCVVVMPVCRCAVLCVVMLCWCVCFVVVMCCWFDGLLRCCLLAAVCCV